MLSRITPKPLHRPKSRKYAVFSHPTKAYHKELNAVLPKNLHPIIDAGCRVYGHTHYINDENEIFWKELEAVKVQRLLLNTNTLYSVTRSVAAAERNPLRHGRAYVAGMSL